ncbi:MAG: hypothetical protein WBF33_24265 [Candidatus Nitrosopolaris sp.]
MNTIYLIRRFIILITIGSKSASTQKTNTNTLGKSFYNENSVVSKYLNSVAVMNGSTAVKYRERLKKFEVFLSEHYGSGIDEIT